MSADEKTKFITERIQVKDTPCSFQIAFVKDKWAIRIINDKENTVLRVFELKKLTSTYITNVIQDIISRKLPDDPDIKIDEMDLGAKMAEVLKKIDAFQKET